MKQQSLLKKISRFILIVLAAIWMMFEDWVWDSILAVMEKVGRLKLVHRLESFIQNQNKYLLVSLFLFPFLIMIPAKLYGVYLIANGKFLRGVTIFIVAKGLITALLTRLFVISKSKLLEIRAFAVSYSWFKEKKEWLYAELDKHPSWQAAKRMIAKLKMQIAGKMRLIKKTLSK